MNTISAKPRIVLYGIGQYGGYVARFAAQKGWPIVAAFNRAGPKVGQDLGRVVGLGRDLGIVVQDCDSGNYDALKGKADIGIVTQTNVLRVNFAAYRRLMSAGLNVLCHGSESYFPYGCDPTTATEIDALAKQQGVTFTGGGIWDMSRIWAGILVAGPCTELKSIFHSSLTSVEGQCVTKEQALQSGAGMTVEEYHATGLTKSPLLISYKSVPEHVLAALGYTITATKTRVEPIVAETPLESAFMECTIPAGRCIGTRVIGDIETKEGVTGRIEFRATLFGPGDIEHMFWSVVGMPHTRIRTEREDSAHATAACLFNRIPDVIAAPPGIVPISRMGPLKSTARL